MKCLNCGDEMEMGENDTSLEETVIHFKCLECEWKTIEKIIYDENGRVSNIHYTDINTKGYQKTSSLK